MRRLAAPTILAVFALGCASVPAHERPWIEVRTGNFEIASCLGADETLEIARNLELFRALAQKIIDTDRFDPVVPTRIYAFADAASFQDFRPSADVAGYFASTPRANFVAILGSHNMEANTVAQHEYVHFLMRNQGSFSYPAWYDEGFAELLSSVEVEGDLVHFGRAPRHRVGALRHVPWIPISRIMQARNLEGWERFEKAMFYAESWALTHYLLYGRPGGEPASSQLTHYLRLLTEDLPHFEIVEEAFGAREEELDREVRTYVSRGKFPMLSIPVERLAVRVDPEVRPMERAAVAAELGGVALLLRRHPKAEELFRAAIASDPGRARAHAGLGDSLRFQERWEEAAPHYARALELGPEDAWVQLDHAEYLQARAERAADAESRADLLRQARAHYARSWELADDVPETYAMYGSTFLAEGEDAQGGLDALGRAHRLLPSDLTIQLLLARVYVALDRGDEARPLLENVMARSHDDAQVAEARALLDGLQRPTS